MTNTERSLMQMRRHYDQRLELVRSSIEKNENEAPKWLADLIMNAQGEAGPVQTAAHLAILGLLCGWISLLEGRIEAANNNG